MGPENRRPASTLAPFRLPHWPCGPKFIVSLKDGSTHTSFLDGEGALPLSFPPPTKFPQFPSKGEGTSSSLQGGATDLGQKSHSSDPHPDILPLGPLT